VNGRRAKQRRRLVWMAGCGDEWAQQWCIARMTPARIDREITRHIRTEALRSVRCGRLRP